jgi:hypothetical protein
VARRARREGQKRTPVGETERLDALHQSGPIDDDEFAEMKRRAMWGDDSPAESSS